MPESLSCAVEWRVPLRSPEVVGLLGEGGWERVSAGRRVTPAQLRPAHRPRPVF